SRRGHRQREKGIRDSGNGKPIREKDSVQGKCVVAVAKHDIVCGVGTAATEKAVVAVVLATAALKKGGV
ncbi:PhoH family protein, partial [Enterococcus lactis]|nr:PhoH family protein [Enterococcus lactis]